MTSVDPESQPSGEGDRLIMNAEAGVRSPRQRLTRSHSSGHPTTKEVLQRARLAAWSSHSLIFTA